jgi:hypothetical protein
MKKILVLACLALNSLLCNAAQPSEESIEKLMTTMQTQKMIATMLPQMEAMMQSMSDKSLDSQTMTPEARAKAKTAAAATVQKMMPIMRKLLSWENLEKMYIPIYRDTFTQEEIDGLIAFYASPAGKALVEKMPLVLQKTMASTQQMITPMLQELQKIATDAEAEAETK